MINQNTLKQADSLAEKFGEADPYPHICIDNFLDESVAEQVLKDFPSFDSTPKKNEFGNDGPKAVYESISDISPFYQKLSDYLKSEDFNNAISKITGIEGLRWGGESMYGGGTHENINGAELDPHVDFNYDDRTKEHRRINLLLYLNKEWEQSWGGEFELHSDPRNPDKNQIKSYLPLFNRAVLMETSERSWHGFPRISLPPEKEHLSRKSLALYFYTKDRPKEEIKGGHGTFYVQRPLPESFRVGEVISKKLYDEVKYLVFKRDEFLRLQHQIEIEASERFDSLESYFKQLQSQLKVPILGWAKQTGSVRGYYHDDWLEKDFSGDFIAQRLITSVSIRFYVAESAKLPMTINFEANGTKSLKKIEKSGWDEVSIEVEIPKGENINISFNASTTVSGANNDNRELSVILYSLVFE